MSNTHTTLSALFTAIANAIRSKKGTTESIIADNFPAEIESLDTRFKYINKNVQSIPYYGFYNCEELDTVDCPNITTIGVSAFENCTNLKSVILYDKVTSISQRAFSNCKNLTSITIPDSVTSIGSNAFKGCSKDLVIYCEHSSTPEGWHKDWNPDNLIVVYNEPIETWDISATSEDDVSAKFYKSIAEDKYLLSIEGRGNMKSYSSSPPWRTSQYNYGKDLVNLKLSGISNIGAYAFEYCSSLTSVTIPDSVTSIGNSAFRNCTSLTSINIPDSVTTIGSYAFNNCDNLTSITIPDNVTSISSYAFESCDNLTSVTLGNSVESIGDMAFLRCSSLTSVIIPDSVISIGDWSFLDCYSLTSVTLGNSVESIGDNAFKECNLTSIIIPDSVTSIGDSAFEECTRLKNITFNGTIAQWNAISFGSFWILGVPATYIQCSDGQVALR